MGTASSVFSTNALTADKRNTKPNKLSESKLPSGRQPMSSSQDCVTFPAPKAQTVIMFKVLYASSASSIPSARYFRAGSGVLPCNFALPLSGHQHSWQAEKISMRKNHDRYRLHQNGGDLHRWILLYRCLGNSALRRSHLRRMSNDQRLEREHFSRVRRPPAGCIRNLSVAQQLGTEVDRNASDSETGDDVN